MPCSASPTASRCWSTAASSPPARRTRSARTRRYARPTSGRKRDAGRLVLEVRGLEAAYGRSQVLFGISFEIQNHQIVSLLGRNGMGKTTTVKSVMGILRPKAGEVRFNGAQTTALPSYRIAQAG